MRRVDFVDPCGIDAQNADPMFVYFVFFEYLFDADQNHCPDSSVNAVETLETDTMEQHLQKRSRRSVADIM